MPLRSGKEYLSTMATDISKLTAQELIVLVNDQHAALATNAAHYNTLAANLKKCEDDLKALKATPKIYKLDSNTKKFGGSKDEDVTDWLYMAETSLKNSGAPTDKYVDLISIYFTNSASGFVRKVLEEATGTGTPLTWNEFKQKLIDRYVPKDLVYRIRNRLKTLKQTQSFDDYVEQFLNTTNKIKLTDIPEAERLFYFLEGLRPDTRHELKQRKVTSIDDAIVKGRDFEEVYNNSNRTKHEPVLQVVHKHSPQSNFVRSVHKSSNRYRSQAPSASHRSSNSYNKKSYAHSVPQSQYKQTQTVSQSSSSGVNAVKCYNCNKFGHYRRNCPQNKQIARVHTVESVKPEVRTEFIHAVTTSTEMLHTRANINGIAMTVYFDSGATISIMSHKIAERHKLGLSPCDLQIRAANNHIAHPLGVTAQLQVEVYGHVCTMPFYVLEHDDHPILLGLDWFKQSGAGIVPGSRTLFFPEEKFHLFENDVDNEYLESSYVNTIVVDDDLEPFFEFSSKTLTIEPEVEKSIAKIAKSDLHRLYSLVDDRIAHDFKDLGACTLGSLKINLLDCTPIRLSIYRKSQAANMIIDAEISKMLDAGIIEHSESPWSFSVVLIPKKNGSPRLCIDYRKLNAITVPDPFPLPRIQDILDGLSGSIWFTTFDLKSGYYQMLLDESSKIFTAFSTTTGHYQFKRAPFGLKNLPSQFSRCMVIIFGKFSFVSVYLDDIIVHSRTLKEHLKHNIIVLEVLKTYNLKINAEKCSWFQNKVKVLGFIVENQTVSPDPAKVQPIKDRKPPETVKQLQEFLGLINYYRPFLRNLAELAYPLHQLLKKDCIWNWSSDCDSAFQSLKNLLTSKPLMLDHPDLNKPFKLYTDASNYALGAILAQADDTGCERVCAYASRALKGAEVHYAISEKECLAVVWAIRFFQVYLEGTVFTVITDHAALSWLKQIPEKQGRLARWAIYLQNFSFDVQYRPGSKHQNVDALSRPVLSLSVQAITSTDDDVSAKTLDVHEDSTLLHFLLHKNYPSGTSKKQIKRINRSANKYVLRDGEIFHRSSENDSFNLLVPKPEVRNDLILKQHLFGHFQAATVYDHLKQNYYWCHMFADIQRVIRQCEKCRRHHKTVSINQPAIAIPIESIFDRIGIDLVFGLPENDDNFTGILVITEYLSKYPYATPIRSKSAPEIASHLLNYICLFGPPKIILSDQGTEFNNELLDSLLKSNHIEHHVTAPYNPRCNGMTERFNQTLITILRKFCEENQYDWHKWLPFALYCYRTRIHSITGFTPYKLLFGREANNFADYSNTFDLATLTHPIVERQRQIKELVDKLYPEALANINKKQQAQIKTQNKQHKTSDKQLAIGSQVYLQVDGLRKKLDPRYKGPFFVHEILANGNYKLKDSLGQIVSQSYPRHKLKFTDVPTQNPDVYYEVAKILDDKIDDKTQYFFVKWKEQPDSENSWITASDFSSMKMVNDYLRNKRAAKRQQLNYISFSPRLNYSWLMMAFLFSFIMISSATIQVNHTFQYCSSTSIIPLDFATSCIPWKQSHFKLSEHAPHFYTVLNKRHHVVDGKGYQCQLTRLYLTIKVDFWGETFRSTATEHVKLSRDDCLAMIYSKQCMGHRLICSDGICKIRVEPVNIPVWWATITTSGIDCSVVPRTIIGNDVNTVLFSAEKQCKARDLVCVLPEATIIWEKEVIHTCPYDIVRHVKLIDTDDHFFVDPQQNILFQLQDTVIYPCGFPIYPTMEGLYITNTSFTVNLTKTNQDINIIHELQLSEFDYQKLNEFIHYRKMTTAACFNMLNTLRSLTGQNDNFIRFYTAYGETFVIFVKHQNIYIPNCANVTSIELIDNTYDCYEHLPIIFTYANTTVRAFIQSDLIIRSTSRKVLCENVDQIFQIGNKFVTRDRNKIFIRAVSDMHPSRLTFFDRDADKLNFQHSQEIIDGIDVLIQLENVTHSVESVGTFFVQPSIQGDITHDTPMLNTISSGVRHIVNDITSYVTTTIVIVVIIATIMLFTPICLTCRKFLLTRFKVHNKPPCPTIVEDVEMHPLDSHTLVPTETSPTLTEIQTTMSRARELLTSITETTS